LREIDVPDLNFAVGFVRDARRVLVIGWETLEGSWGDI